MPRGYFIIWGYIDSGTKIKISQDSEWFFIPFNFRHESRAEKLNDSLKSLDININSILLNPNICNLKSVKVFSLKTKRGKLQKDKCLKE